MNNNFFEIIAEKVSDRNKLFLKEINGSSYKYRDMEDLTGQYANLFKNLGVIKGDRVALQTGKIIDCIWIYLSLLRIGAIYLPLNPSYTTEEVKYFIEDAEPTLFISEKTFSEELKAILLKNKTTHETISNDGDGSLQKKLNNKNNIFTNEKINKDDIACILYTSGTTGKSKGAMITHENLSSNALTLVKSWSFTSKDKLLHALPIFHVHGLFVAINTILLSGGSILFFKKFDTEEVIENLPFVTSMMGVPTFYSRLVSNKNFNKNISKHIRVFISGSAPLSVDVHNKFKNISNHDILERYGMTETGMITSNPYNGEKKPGTVGFPLENITVRICNPDSGELMPDGEIGVIEVKGPNVFKGYWKMPERTKNEFRADGYFITGDLGYIDPDGYVCISGRDKDLIISGGLNIYPAEIENALDSIDIIKESAVIGLSHLDFGEAVTAIVVVNNKNQFNEKIIINSLSKILAKFKLPKNLIAVDELPRNSMGKIQKNKLREEYEKFYLKESI